MAFDKSNGDCLGVRTATTEEIQHCQDLVCNILAELVGLSLGLHSSLGLAIEGLDDSGRLVSLSSCC